MKALEKLLCLFTQKTLQHENVPLLKTIQLVKQSLLYFKITHDLLNAIDSKFREFYTLFDDNMDLLCQEKSRLKRRSLMTNVLQQIMKRQEFREQRE